MGAIFSHPHALPPGFEERSIYLFDLIDGAGEPATAAARRPAGEAAAPAESRDADLVDRIRMGLGPAARAVPAAPATAAKGAFVPNIVVSRERTASPLAAYATEKERELLQRSPAFRLVREGPYTVAGLPGHEAEFIVTVDEPALRVAQWQVVTIRDGYAYLFTCTTAADRLAEHRRRFAAFVDGWR